MHTQPEFVAIWRLLAVLTTVVGVCGCGGASPSRDGASVPDIVPIRVAQSPTDVEFSMITGVGVDSRGRIYVGDRLGEVIVLDGGGRLHRRFGRMGKGPGEFEMIGTVALLPGDSLFVYDGSAVRATVYAPDSDRVAYTVRFPEPGFSFPMAVEPTSSGYLIGHFRRIHGDLPDSEQPRSDIIRILNRDGSIRRDSVLAVREPDVSKVRSGRSEGIFTPDFARQALLRWDAQGRFYSLWTDSAAVTIYGLDGKRIRTFSAALSGSRLPLSNSTIDSVAERNAGGGLTKRMLSEAFRERWQTWPLVEDMLVDDQSRVWLKPVTHDSVAEWAAFDQRGTRVAALRLPQSVIPRLIRGDRMYAVSKDSLDVESLVVYRLAPSSPRTRERR